ncbi:protein-tyrosine phosphatase-like protein [Scenedesmus sp. NREL 46B-D3]|nr:protein-tyrosine phosphatase-like protein [Scenedesmus sp. NREL 46B-D3]
MSKCDRVQAMGPANASRWSFESDPDALLDHPSLQPDRIADTNVFLSSAFTEGALEVLKRHGITHVLQVGFELEAHHPGAFTYCSIQVADRFESDIVQCLPQAFAFITHGIQDGRVLVHCLHGQSRSAAVVIAFLMWSSGQTYEACLARVQACRPRVQPNRGFEMQLRLLGQLRFDLSKWPGWSAETYIVACQQRLLWQHSDGSYHRPMDAHNSSSRSYRSRLGNSTSSGMHQLAREVLMILDSRTWSS